MFNQIIINTAYLFIFGVYVFLPVSGAYSFARYLTKEGICERIALTFAVFFLEGILSFGIAGVLGVLNMPFVFVLNAVLGAGLFLFFRKKGNPVPTEPTFELYEKILLALFFAGIIFQFYLAVLFHSGTDMFLYHFFFPVSWIAEGKIFPITLIGLPTEYFPVYGELLYGWLMLPTMDASIAIFLQLLSFVAASFAVFALAKEFGFSRFAGLAAASIIFYTSIVAANMAMGYTDVLNGSFLLMGFSFLLISCLRNDTKLFILAGCILGCSASIKYSGLMLTPLLTLVFVIFFFFYRKQTRLNLLWLCLAAGFSALPAYIGYWIKTGNPFYPVKISVFGFDIFGNGLAFERPPVGIGADTLRFLTNDRTWDMNYPTMLLLLILPILILLLMLFSKQRFKKEIRLIYLILSIVVIGLMILQFKIYPAMAQARQMIPLLMLYAILLLPLFEYIFSLLKSNSKKILAVFGIVLLCLIFRFIRIRTNAAQIIWCFTFGFLFCIAFCRDKRFIRICVGIMVLLILLLPYMSAFRFFIRESNRYFFAGETGERILDAVETHYYETRRKGVMIASVAGWYNYMFLEDMPGNKVRYIPISRKNSTHAHDFGSYEAMREDPVGYEEWLARLRDAGADFLLVDLQSHTDGFYNKEVEKKWAEAHPETFTKLVDDGKITFYKIIRPD